MGMEVQNHKVESHEMGSISDSELVYHVKETLRAVPLGDRHNYELLVAVMHLESDRDVLEPSLRALSCAVSYLDIVHHEALLTSIFNTNMWAYEPYEMDALMALIISLLKMIVIYVENMLELEKGELGELVRCPMLMALVDRLIDLDVEIGWDDNSHDDSGKGIFEMDLEDTEEAACHAEQDIDKLPKGSLSWKSGKEQIAAELLDQLMVLTFEHLKSCQSEGRLIEVFDILLQSFQITVLNAYKSKFAQFVMFYACALDPENCGVRFSTMLAGLFVSGVHSQLTRMSAVSYLASFLSRAKFLSASFVIRFLKRLVDWCLEYCKVHGGDINPKAHRVFYSGCQAIMYVLCFRMRSIMDIPRLKSQLLLMPLETILKHELNPFKVCLPSVVCEFLRQSKAAHLFTVSKTFIFNDLLESELSRAFGGLERLDMFFPFDPCLLKKCDSYIRPNFVYWSMVRTTYHDDDEVDSSEEDVDEDFVDGKGDDVMEDGMRSDEEEDPDDDEFDYNALSKMSITPKNCVGLMVQ
ncbi:RNA polymerase I-specific transcription initiation factor rrn3 isoform X2 [Mangifera indica]|uniref:RNA polymerase I-specific transcription initiation factor rrn3 isoform X2 n=1 Tax=Mangifera indica TaxID=29780 RepID=UPI001CFB760C|nr:RNA polymerase I-specific transcription initiation factor rrn3 isoform X2 [Mangifera indica]